MIFQKMNKYAYDVAPSGPALQHLLTSPTHLEGSNQRGARPTCRHRNSEIASHRHPSALAFTQSPIIQQPLLMLIPHDVFMEQRPSPSACYGNYSTSIFIFIVFFFFQTAYQRHLLKRNICFLSFKDEETLVTQYRILHRKF